jgi:hypothetical protein
VSPVDAWTERVPQVKPCSTTMNLHTVVVQSSANSVWVRHGEFPDNGRVSVLPSDHERTNAVGARQCLCVVNAAITSEDSFR